jgi:beta-phosphoglucomutase-like phosphatase (HAD superfamily)
VFDELVRRMRGIDDALASSLYLTLTDGWRAYDDAVPVLRALQHSVPSCEIGVTKPRPAAFLRAVDPLGSTPGSTVMVGDMWSQDEAAEVRTRTLILPRATGNRMDPPAVASLVLEPACRCAGVLG